MRGAFAIDCRIDLRQVAEVAHAFRHDCDAVRDFFIRKAQNFLAHDFGRNDALRLVCERIFREEVSARLRQCDELLTQRVHAVAVLRGDRHHSFKVVERGELRNLLHQNAFVLQKVNLIDGEQRRHT